MDYLRPGMLAATGGVRLARRASSLQAPVGFFFSFKSRFKGDRRFTFGCLVVSICSLSVHKLKRTRIPPSIESRPVRPRLFFVVFFRKLSVCEMSVFAQRAI